MPPTRSRALAPAPCEFQSVSPVGDVPGKLVDHATVSVGEGENGPRHWKCLHHFIQDRLIVQSRFRRKQLLVSAPFHIEKTWRGLSYLSYSENISPTD